MYLVNKLCGVRIGRMYVPACLKEYTTNIVGFVLASPGVDKNKAEFKIEGEKTMETQETNGIEEIIKEITSKQSDDNSNKEAENTNEDNGINLLDALMPLMLRALMHNAVLSKEIIFDLDKRVTALENKKCDCCKTESEEQAA